MPLMVHPIASMKGKHDRSARYGLAVVWMNDKTRGRT